MLYWLASELAFMLADNNHIQDPIERHDDLTKFHAQAQTQGQVGRGEQAGHGNRGVAIGLQGPFRPRNEHGAITIAHARPAGT